MSLQILWLVLCYHMPGHFAVRAFSFSRKTVRFFKQLSSSSRNLWEPCCQMSSPFGFGSLPVWCCLWFAMRGDVTNEPLWAPSSLEKSCKPKWVVSQWNQPVNESIKWVQKYSLCFQGELKNASLIIEEPSLHMAADPLPPWYFQKASCGHAALNTEKRRQGGNNILPPWPCPPYRHISWLRKELVIPTLGCPPKGRSISQDQA